MNTIDCRSFFLIAFLLAGLWQTTAAQQDSNSSVLRDRGLVQGEPYESIRFDARPSTELSILTVNGSIEIFGNPDRKSVV